MITAARQKDITEAIRDVDKKHIIIIEGNAWGNNYNGLTPLWDSNMVFSFHKYWNNNDQNSIERFVKIREEQNVPIWMGESGENSNAWFTDAISLLERNKIGWAWWPLKKLGFNNPLQIKSNHNYDNLVDYWNGKKENPPKESDVYSGLLELAVYSNIKSNIKHPDVVDAMLRQPFSNDSKPFSENKIFNGAVLKAVDYDLGRNGVAYYDKDTANYRISSGKASVGNRGGIYRNDGVDIYKDSSAYESYYIGSIENGEWLQYTINVTEAGTYTLSLTISAESDTGKIVITDSKGSVAKTTSIPATGSNKKWEIVKIKNMVLSAGIHKLKIDATRGGFNLKAVLFQKQE